MPHIKVDPSIPGIRSLMAARPEMAVPLRELAQTLLRGPSTLSPGERELIAATVSARNGCSYCERSHSATAAHLLEGGTTLVEMAKENPGQAAISAKMKALLTIAAKVQQSGRDVATADVTAARAEGASDDEIHDTVLIAAAFCMYNRYVDGLGAMTPEDPAVYDAIGKNLAERGYR